MATCKLSLDPAAELRRAEEYEVRRRDSGTSSCKNSRDVGSKVMVKVAVMWIEIEVVESVVVERVRGEERSTRVGCRERER